MNKEEFDRFLNDCKMVTDRYPVKVSEHYRGLIQRPGDPLGLQCMPSSMELSDHFFLIDDGLGEEGQSPCSRLVHRYPDRVLLNTTNSCFSYCRFCLRKRFWKKDVAETEITEKELADVVSYINEHREIKEVLISGGDPLTLSDEKLLDILSRVSNAGSVQTIRLCSRAPVFQPGRITKSLADKLGEFDSLWFVTHFNHPDELTESGLNACRLLKKRGIPILNQTVLLSGVNDDPDVLIALFRALAAKGIKPHYLFSADPIAGTSHFAVPISRGLEILRVLRGKLSSIAMPTYAIDLPEGGGKVPLQPDYNCGEDGVYESIDGRRIFHPLAGKQIKGVS